MFPVSVGVLEILVSGVTASIWFGMLVAILAGWDEPPGWLTDGPTSLLLYATLAYGLGVVIDGVADSLFITLLKRGWPNPKRPRPNPIARTFARLLSPRNALRQIKVPMAGSEFERLREAALLRDDGLGKFMEYQRSRQRIARDMALNLLLLLPIGIWFLADNVGAKDGVVTAFAVAVVIGIIVSGRTAERLRDAYESHLLRMPSDQSVNALAQIRAAAVCVRVRARTELLLVQTKEKESSPRERWTFPKGHIEVGESLPEAAMREASEESGASGRIDFDPLPPYRFPAGSSGASVVVIPFLIETGKLGEPSEPGRSMRWATMEEAKALLRQDREHPFTDEHNRVVDAAVQRIGGG